MEISADQLDTLYRSDSSGANAKLSDKTITVKGIVDKVFVREHLEIRYIVLRGAGKSMMCSIRCTFNKEDSSKLNRLTEGECGDGAGQIRRLQQEHHVQGLRPGLVGIIYGIV